jgi:putative aldouronate transport system substrate-binding protein
MKKSFILMVVFSLIFVLFAACSGNGNNTSTNVPDKSSETKGGNNENANAGGDNAGSDEVVELSLFINHSWYPLSEWTGTIAETITQKTGVKLNVTVATDTEQLPLMIASGDLPDLVFTTREPRLSNPDISYDWNELIEQYAPDFKIDPIRQAVNAAPDGNLYTVLNAFATPEEWANNPNALGNDGNAGIAVRQDIMDELGNPSIDSLNGFMDVLGQVKNQYPDMVPMTMDIEWIPQYFRMQFGIPQHSSWYEEDGELNYEITHPNMLKFYKFMNSLYRNGYILAENFTYSNDQIDNEYAESGRAFAHSHTVSTADSDNAAIESLGHDYRFTMIPSVLTDEAFNVDSSNGFSGVYITKNNKNPEKSIKLLEYLASEEGKELVMFGIEGEQWNWSEDGTYPVFNYDVNDEKYRDQEGHKWWYLYSDAIVEGLRGYVPGTQTTKALKEIKSITEYKPSLGMVKLQDGSEEKVIFDKLEEMVTNEQIKIFLAESEEAAEQAYQNMLQIAEGIGMSQLERWATEEYQEKKSLFK